MLESRKLESLSRAEATARLTELTGELAKSGDDAVLDLSWTIRAPKTQT